MVFIINPPLLFYFILKQKAIIFSKLKIVSIQVFKNIVHNQVCKSFQTPSCFSQKNAARKEEAISVKKKRGQEERSPSLQPIYLLHRKPTSTSNLPREDVIVCTTRPITAGSSSLSLDVLPYSSDSS
jgi:hypothetical protein